MGASPAWSSVRECHAQDQSTLFETELCDSCVRRSCAFVHFAERRDNTIRGELREVAWLASVVGGFSVLGVAAAVALAAALSALLARV